MEFFYFGEYWPLSPEEQRRLRKTQLDICDQNLYSPGMEAVVAQASARNFSQAALRVVGYRCGLPSTSGSGVETSVVAPTGARNGKAMESLPEHLGQRIQWEVERPSVCSTPGTHGILE
jgi:hypothetical protein